MERIGLGVHKNGAGAGAVRFAVDTGVLSNRHGCTAGVEFYTLRCRIPHPKQSALEELASLTTACVSLRST